MRRRGGRGADHRDGRRLCAQLALGARRGVRSRARPDRDRRDCGERAVAAQAGALRGGFDLYSFAISLKGVLLEGAEVALIVMTLGAERHRLALSALAAAAAVVAVIAAGLAARAPLARVPENTMKFAVGVMLSAYGTFWAAEGAGLSWPAGDASLIGLVAVVLSGSLLAVAAVRRHAGVAGAR